MYPDSTNCQKVELLPLRKYVEVLKCYHIIIRWRAQFYTEELLMILVLEEHGLGARDVSPAGLVGHLPS